MKVYECCGIESVTKKLYCQKCGKEIVNEREVSGKGTVFSYTIIHVPPAEYVHLAPYTVALVQLNDSTARLTVRIDAEVAIGDAVELAEQVEGAYVYKPLATVE